MTKHILCTVCKTTLYPKESERGTCWYCDKNPDGYKRVVATRNSASQVSVAPAPEPVKEEKPKPAPTKKMLSSKADKLRKMADGLQKSIDDKFRERETNTAKRLREAGKARCEGQHIQRVQRLMRILADGHEAGNLSPLAQKAKTKGEIEHAMSRRWECSGPYPVELNEWSHSELMDRELQVLYEERHDQSDDAKAQEAAAVEMQVNDVRLKNIPGYFASPSLVVKRVLDIADIQENDVVLEPSAGDGALIDGAFERCVNITGICVEANHTLVEILEKKGYSPRHGDFLEMGPDEIGVVPDVVIMNPPFEKGADMDHVRHAYDLVGSGGRVVAVMSSGAFFRSDSKATAFREWFEKVDGSKWDLPKDSFKSVGTGVSAVVVMIDKEE